MKNYKNRQFLEASYGLPIYDGGCVYEEDILRSVITDESETIDIIKNELKRASEFLNTNSKNVSLVYNLSIFAETSDVRYCEINDEHKYIFNINPTVIPNVVSLRLVEEGYILDGNYAYSEEVFREEPIYVNFNALMYALDSLKLEKPEIVFNQVVSAVSEGDSFIVRVGSVNTNKVVKKRTKFGYNGRINRQ